MFNSYTNRSTGRTTVMHGVTLCGYVDRVVDPNRPRGFYYAVSVAKSGDVVPSYCVADDFTANVKHVQEAWSAA